MKHKLTIQQHSDIAGPLLDSIQRVGLINLRASQAYGKRSKPARSSDRAFTVLQRLRSALDDALCAEHPRDDSVLTIYYPDRQKTR